MKTNTSRQNQSIATKKVFTNVKVKMFLPLIALMLMNFNGWGQTTIWTEDFSAGTNYSITLGAEGEDGSSDYFIRTDDNTGHNIGVNYSNTTGYFFAGQDIDDGGWSGSDSPSELTWTGINISGYTSLSFSGNFASNATSKIDAADYIHIKFRIDGGSWTDLIWFENDGNTYNTGFGEDTDFDGISDGSDLSSTFSTFTKSISGTGSLLDLRITCAINSGGEDFAFDEFEILGTTVSANDNDTEIYSPTTQVASKTISSLDDTQSEAEDVFTFTIEDQGTADGLATKVTNIRLTPHTSNTADWTDAIQDVFIDNDGSNFIYPTADITDTYIDLAFGASDLNIADGSSKDITIWLYLNTSNIIDGSILSFAIDGSNHGFTADASGSDFSSSLLLGGLHSNDMTINVEASELQFTQQPGNVNVGNAVSPSPAVAYIDVNGNIDKDYDGTGFEIDLTTTGSFDASATTTVAPNSGIATFNNVIFDATGTGVTITGTDNNGWISSTTIQSGTFDITNTPTTPDIWLNEIHYDNNGGDANEFVEIALVDASSYNLSHFTVTLYNGSNASSYDSETLNNFTSGTTYGNITLYTWYPSSIQNGDPDGVAISWNDGSKTEQLIQFLSYEGDFTASNGPASGQNSTDIGVNETSSTLASESLQLIGTGSTYSDFSWATPSAATSGQENSASTDDQSFPVEILSFEGFSQNNANLLKWTTATEKNNDYFTLEKSTDGESFNQVTTVPGVGNSNDIQYYQAKDFNVDASLTYYRLKQTDYNGAYTYSDVIAVREKMKNQIEMKMLRENSCVKLQINNLNPNPVTIEMFDLQGRKVLEKSIYPAKKHIHVNMDTYTNTGIYIIRVLQGNQVLTEKIML